MGRGHRREGREGGRGSSQIRRRNGDDQVTLSKLSKTPARRGARVRRGYTRTTFGMHGGAAGLCWVLGRRAADGDGRRRSAGRLAAAQPRRRGGVWVRFSSGRVEG